mmetsp:Transcript_95404/g.270053  ORF Transcript_95404/g.270053 Transcript_95404/m.270053 type:complete len:306 (+) Transcript_95404:782-1699(+)
MSRSSMPACSRNISWRSRSSSVLRSCTCDSRLMMVSRSLDSTTACALHSPRSADTSAAPLASFASASWRRSSELSSARSDSRPFTRRASSSRRPRSWRTSASRPRSCACRARDSHCALSRSCCAWWWSRPERSTRRSSRSSERTRSSSAPCFSASRSRLTRTLSDVRIWACASSSSFAWLPTCARSASISEASCSTRDSMCFRSAANAPVLSMSSASLPRASWSCSARRARSAPWSACSCSHSDSLTCSWAFSSPSARWWRSCWACASASAPALSWRRLWRSASRRRCRPWALSSFSRRAWRSLG